MGSGRERAQIAKRENANAQRTQRTKRRNEVRNGAAGEVGGGGGENEERKRAGANCKVGKRKRAKRGAAN